MASGGGERTPLLNSPTASYGGGQTLWTISDGLSRLAGVPLSSLTAEVLLGSSRGSGGWNSQAKAPAIDFAYSITLLLYLRNLRITSTPPIADVYSTWNNQLTWEADVKHLDQSIQGLWDSFLSDYRTDQDIDCVLWSPFEEDSTSARRLRAADFLVKTDPPMMLVTHPLIEAALDRRWKHGRSYTRREVAHSSALERIESALATPWNMHLLTITSQFIYLGLLASYLLDPPDRVTTQIGRYPHDHRLYSLLLFLSSSTFSPHVASKPLLIGVLLMFIMSLPSCPQPDGGFFEVLLVIFGLHILRLHLPTIPSPALLISPSQILPLSVFMIRNVTNVLPAFIFFGPALVLSVILLSYSLDGRVSPTNIVSTLFTFSASPMVTRWAFFIIAIITFFLWFLGTFMASIVLPSLNRPDGLPNKWDRFGVIPGQEARKIAVLALITFDEQYVFPPPFNLPYILLIAPLEYGLNRFELNNHTFVLRCRVFLWRVTVLPFLIPLFCASKLIL